MAKIRFSAKEKTEFEALPKGTYAFEIEAVDENTSGNGNPQVLVKMRVMEGPHADKKSTAFFTLTDKAAWRLRELFEAVGAPVFETGETDENGTPLFECDPEDLIGKCVVFGVTVDKYEGRENNKFNTPKAYGAVASGAVAPAGAPGGAAPAGGFQPPPQGFAPPQTAGGPPAGWAPQGFVPPQGAPGAAPPAAVDRRPRNG